MKKQLLVTFASILILLSFSGLGCKQPPRVKTAEEKEAENMIMLPNYFIIEPQQIGQKVIIREVKFEKPGFAVIHDIKTDGTTGAVLGYSNIIPQGYQQNIKIALITKLDPTKQYIAMLHDDTDGDTKFNPKKDQTIFHAQNGTIIEKKFGVIQ